MFLIFETHIKHHLFVVPNFVTLLNLRSMAKYMHTKIMVEFVPGKKRFINTAIYLYSL